jgi:predicted aminopeptidase
MLADPNTPQKVRDKLNHVMRVREFARQSIGLKIGNSYTTYSEIDREAASFNVTASRRLALDPRTWWFPIVGTVPYLGFFERERAEALRAELEREGWDAIVDDVPAYSTLGYFNDPLLSSQIRYRDWYLTRLIIHEAAHQTLWLKGDVSYNESFSSFVEKMGALEYHKMHDTPEEYRLKIRGLDEAAAINALFLNYARRLDAIFKGDASDQEKLRNKMEMLTAFDRELTAVTKEFQAIHFDNRKGSEWNNAHFLSYVRYHSGEDHFSKIFEKCNSDWRCFFEAVQREKL